MRKLVFITGGTSGLGRAIADVLADKYDLALGYREDIRRAEQTVSEISQLFPKAKIRAYKAPLNNYESSQFLYKSVLEDFPTSPIYGLVHCAGRTSTTLYASSSFQAQLSLIEEHLISAMALTHLCLPSMYKNKSGRIVFMSSIGANYAFRGQAGYAAAKSGIEAFARTLALEVAHRGITVNCVAPGLIDTPLTHDKIQSMDPLDIRNVNPTGLLPKPADVASLVHYLMLEEVRFITGTSIPVDGGQSLGDSRP